MPWVVKKEEKDEEEAPKPEKKAGKSEGKGGKQKDAGSAEKGGKKGKSKGEKDGFGFDDKGKGKKGKGKGKEDEPPRASKGGSKSSFPAKSKGRGDDEAGKGKGGKKGGKGKGRSEEDGDRPVKTNRSEDIRRQASALAGAHCTVRKHSSMGCAVISMNAAAVRQAILEMLPEKVEIGDHTLSLKPHSEKDTDQEILTDIFVGWGRQAEKINPLDEKDLANFFDQKHVEFTTTGRIVHGYAKPMTEEEKRAQAAKVAAAQAQWAAAGGQQVRPPLPPGPAPGAFSQQQAMAAQQQQYMAAMQAQYMMQMQQRQAYMAAVQAQQKQQEAWQKHLVQQQEAMQAQRVRKGYKASYRVPTEEEVKATFANLAKPKTEETAEAAAEAAPEAAAEAAPPAAEA